MYYYKRNIFLKERGTRHQPIILTVEKRGLKLGLAFSEQLSSDARLALSDGSEFVAAPCPKSAEYSCSLNVENGLSAAVFENGKMRFYGCNGGLLTPNDLTELYEEKAMPKAETPRFQGNDGDGGTVGYDDTKLADDNYYLYDSTPIQPSGTATQSTIADDENQPDGRERANAFGSNDEQQTQVNAQPEPDFYERACDKIEDIFSRFEPVTLGCLPDARLAKITFAEGKHYLFGTLSKNGEVLYIIYGVPSGENPPKEFSANSVFVPNSPFDRSNGYRFLFQSAKTGSLIAGREV